MTDALDEARDELAHAAWTDQQDRDPHRIHFAGLTPEQRNAYVQWHSAQRRIIRSSIRDANATRRAFGLPQIADSIVVAQLAHHDEMLRRIQATLPPPKPPKVKRTPPPTRAEREAADAARVRSYANTHGLSIRQATEALRTR